MKIIKPLVLSAALAIVAFVGLPAAAQAQPVPKLTPAQAEAFTRWVTHARHVYLFELMAAHERAEAARQRAASQSHGGVRVQGIEVCNGTTLPTCAIVKRESGFNPRAENPRSTASGLYQFIDGTFRYCRTGYGHASYAPVAVQVACARKVWDNGRGARHWRL